METRKIADQDVTIHKYNTVVIGAGVLLGAAAGAIIDALKNKGVDWTAMVMFEEYDAETLRQIGCERSDARQDKQEEALG